MDSMKGQGGIQMLLTAEQEAQQIVSAAKNLKTTRLRQAREEAEKEAALFRTKMEAEYQMKISETSGNSNSTVKQLELETEMKIKTMKETTGKNSPEVIKNIVKYIIKV